MYYAFVESRILTYFFFLQEASSSKLPSSPAAAVNPDVVPPVAVGNLRCQSQQQDTSVALHVKDTAPLSLSAVPICIPQKRALHTDATSCPHPSPSSKRGTREGEVRDNIWESDDERDAKRKRLSMGPEDTQQSDKTVLDTSPEDEDFFEIEVGSKNNENSEEIELSTDAGEHGEVRDDGATNAAESDEDQDDVQPGNSEEDPLEEDIDEIKALSDFDEMDRGSGSEESSDVSASHRDDSGELIHTESSKVFLHLLQTYFH